MDALVTGAAGFIGSNLARRLLAEGRTVRGVDNFDPYYAEQAKRRNIADLLTMPGFEFVQSDLLADDLGPLVGDADLVFHQAGQAGVRLSWAEGFRRYNQTNVEATQRLLEAVRDSGVRRLVFASSSSVYGNAQSYPTSEEDSTQPHSPYGVTKLAAELLCRAYARNFGVPAVALRYFTVYGPSQRPDMAIHRMIESALEGTPFPVFGDGSHVRDFTFVGDVVEANLAAADSDVAPGVVVNVAGGSSITVAELLDLVGEAVGRPVPVERQSPQPGDVDRTGGSIELARELLGWEPRTSIADGVASQVHWHRSLRAS